MAKLLLKGKEVLEMSGEANAHRLALKARVSYPSVERMINRPEEVKAFDASMIVAVLCDGLGLSAEDLLSRKIGDFFTIVETE